jgi:transcriptional regulator with XRE-family HTH domain
MYPNLKLQIFKRGLRQNWLARELGISEAVLSKIIHGYREPSETDRKLLCAYLEAAEIWLFEKFDTTPEPTLAGALPVAGPKPRPDAD